MTLDSGADMRGRPTVGDSFGAMLAAAHEAGAEPGVVYEVIERDDGHVRVGDAARYFVESWGPQDDWVYERVRGSVLDIGCGAGRHALALQSSGSSVLALDVSAGAIDVCRRRGVRETFVGVLDDLETDMRFDTMLLLGNNVGLLGSKDAAPAVLDRLSALARDGSAQVLATGVGREPGTAADEVDRVYERANMQRGRLPWQVTMRSRFRELTTPWFDYLFVRVEELVELVATSPWQVDDVCTEDRAYAVRLTLRHGTS